MICEHACVRWCVVPIDEVYLLSVSPYDAAQYRVGGDGGGELILQQYEHWAVVCVVTSATHTPPSVNVTVQHSADDVMGRDVTDLFSRSVERRPVLLESGLSRHHVTVRLEYVTSQPEPEMNGKTLTCTAAGQPGFSDVSAKATLIVNCTYLWLFIRSIQPGHPFVGRGNEYRRKLARKQAHCSRGLAV